MPISGFLNLGTGFSGSTLVTPPSGTNYAAQSVSFTALAGAIALNGNSCVFGPVSGSWGTLVAFGVTDTNGLPYWSGTLKTPFAPVNGQLVIVPQGDVTLVVGSQMVATPATTVVSPAQGPTVSGSVALSSGSYSLVLASGARKALSLTNTSASGLVQILLGGVSAPASGAAGYSIIPPYGNWPSAGLGDFVPTDSIWAIATASGVTLNYFTG